MLKLKALSPENAREEYECLQEIPDENGFHNECCGLTYETFVSEAIPMHIRMSEGIDLKPGHVPDTWYILWDDGRAVGLFKVRHYLSETLKNGSGHIGYAVRKGERGRGYATSGLALAVEEARSIIPEDEVYLSCNRNNPASLRVMLKNGAYIHHEDDEEYYTRIPLK